MLNEEFNFSKDFDNSGTFDLVGSAGRRTKPANSRHIHSPDASLNKVLATGYDLQDHDMYNIADSSSRGAFNLVDTDKRLDRSLKFAQIDHFKMDQRENTLQQESPPQKAQDVEKAEAATETVEQQQQEVPQTTIETVGPKFPAFEDQLKQIREDFAKQYETKMNLGFEELNELKKDIAQKQQVHETKQVRELRRDVKRLENELVDVQG